ncbi:MAG: ATP-dependent DNA helicase RecG [Acidobacteriota bacterium]
MSSPPESPSLLERSVGELAGVGPVRLAQLQSVGVSKLGHLLALLPSRYEDRSRTATADELESSVLDEEPIGVLGTLEDVRSVPVRRRGLRLVQGRVITASGTLKGLWFNRPYLAKQVKAGQTYRLFGKVRRGRSGLEILNASVEPIEEEALSDGPDWVPIYGRLGDLSPAQVAKLVAAAARRLESEIVPENLPPELLERHGLPALGESLLRLHRPDARLDADALLEGRTPFHARLAYGEFLRQQLELTRRRWALDTSVRRKPLDVDESLLARVAGWLPFELTGAQQRVVGEVASDLRRERPMWRLVQGDVGCGKTAVSLVALGLALENGFQVAYMAPTELLAEQHARTLAEHLPPERRLAVLTGSRMDAPEVREAMARGEVDLVVGTHALFQDSVRFRKLGLVIIDEQHRFGVGQREKLVGKGESVDLLVMTATPIPRSLALTLYGDLDVSVIDELPPGRSPVVTELLSSGEEARKAIQTEIDDGGQVYYVVPFIEASEEISGRSIEEVEEELRQALPQLRLGVVHGRLDAAERDRRMQSFKDGDIDLLLATTVIEVGVDVANASLMVIESADRFGLSQLHQLRGRVGRGARRSRCLALSEVETSRERLEIFERSSDGFAIAEADLERRGPGDLLGKRQSGQPWFRFANPVRDLIWLTRAREDARELIEAESPVAKRPLRDRRE